MNLYRPYLPCIDAVHDLVVAECAKKLPKIIIASDDSDRADASRWGMVNDLSRHNPNMFILTHPCQLLFTALRLLQDQASAAVISMPMQVARELIDMARKTDLNALVLLSPSAGSVQATVIEKGEVVHTVSDEEIKSAHKPQGAFSST